jgi:hypothetical protein
MTTIAWALHMFCRGDHSARTPPTVNIALANLEPAGIGGISPEVLRRLCVEPGTRLARPVTADDVRDAIDVFGGTP